MKVLIFGANGFLGEHFQKLYPGAVIPETDIADPAAVAKVLENAKPDVVINAAGRTGRPNVDWCEDHQEETTRANVTGPQVLLEECGKRGIYWVHLGSGCIYEGDNGGKGFAEDDPPNFSGSFYARSKAAADQILREFSARPDGTGGVLILRLRMPFDGSLNERNLIVKLKKYAKVLDVQNSLTYIPDFLTAAKALIEKRRTGMYHVVNPGTISPFQIVQLYQEIVNPRHTFEKIELHDLPTVVKAGRSNCILSTAKLEREGISLLPVRDAAVQALQTLRASLGERAGLVRA